MGVEAMGELLTPPPIEETLQLPPRAARPVAASATPANSTMLTGATVRRASVHLPADKIMVCETWATTGPLVLIAR